MVSLEKIQETIIELEHNHDTTFATVSKLADLYTVRDNLKGYVAAQPKTLSISGSSEFLQAVDGKNTDAVWVIMNDLMESVQILHPKIYDRVLEKIRNI